MLRHPLYENQVSMQVPVLEFNGKVMGESTDISKCLEDSFLSQRYSKQTAKLVRPE